jgi:hypothetical protein
MCICMLAAGTLVADIVGREMPALHFLDLLIACGCTDRSLHSGSLQEMRTWKEAEQAGVKAGFELVTSIDIATASAVTGPWYSRLAMGKWQIKVNASIVNTLDFFGLAPKVIAGSAAQTVTSAICTHARTSTFQEWMSPSHTLWINLACLMLALWCCHLCMASACCSC